MVHYIYSLLSVFTASFDLDGAYMTPLGIIDLNFNVTSRMADKMSQEYVV